MSKWKIKDELAIMWTLADTQGYCVPFKKPAIFFGIAVVDFLLQIIQLSLIWENFYPENT